MTATNTLFHADYHGLARRWQRCLDAVDGLDAVHAAGERYLSKLAGDDEADYRAYRMRAGWYGATARTVENMMGTAFRRPPAIEAGPLEPAWLDDVTLGGLSATGLARRALEQVLVTGRGAALLEVPRNDGSALTIAAAQAANVRPYIAWYDGPDIINWRHGRVGNRHQLVMAVLRERDALDSNDDFDATVRTTYRVCRLRDEGGRGLYTQQTGAEDIDTTTGTASGTVVWDEERPVVVAGATVDAIPLYLCQPHDDDTVPARPPLLDLVDKNLEHYRATAQHRHGQHWTALPTPWATGVNDTEAESFEEVGPRSMWTSASPDARFGLLEYTGGGLGSLREERQDIKADMASLGARMIGPSTTSDGVRTATEIEADITGETSQLARIVTRVSTQLTRTKRQMAMWGGASEAEAEEVSLDINTDYTTHRMSPTELTALVAAWQSGAMGDEALAWNLKEGERLPPQATVEDEVERLGEIGGSGLPGLEEAA